MLAKQRIMSSCNNRVLPLIKPLNLQQTASTKTAAAAARRLPANTRNFLSPDDAEKCFSFDPSPPDNELVLKFLESQNSEAEARKKRPKIALECMPISNGSLSSAVPASLRITTSSIRRSTAGTLLQPLPPLKTRSRSNISLTSISEMEDIEEEPSTINDGTPSYSTNGISGSRSCPCSPLAHRKNFTNTTYSSQAMDRANLANRINSLESATVRANNDLNNCSSRNSFILPEIKITEGP